MFKHHCHLHIVDQHPRLTNGVVLNTHMLVIKQITTVATMSVMRCYADLSPAGAGMMPPGMMQPGMLPPGMMPPGMHPGMLHAMQYAQLGPGGMPSGQMPQNPTNPLQGIPGVPSAQMEYLQRQMQAMGMQRPQGMGQQPLPGQQMPGKLPSFLLLSVLETALQACF